MRGYFFPSPLWGGTSERSEDRVGSLRRLHPTPAPLHKGEGIIFLLTTFLDVCISSASAPRRRRSSGRPLHGERGAAAVCPRVPEAPWQVRMAVGALSGLRILAPQLGGARPTQLILRN